MVKVIHFKFLVPRICPWNGLWKSLLILYTGWPCELAFRLTNSLSNSRHGKSHDVYKFWEIIDNISEMVQDSDIVTMEE